MVLFTYPVFDGILESEEGQPSCCSGSWHACQRCIDAAGIDNKKSIKNCLSGSNTRCFLLSPHWTRLQNLYF